MRTPYRERQQDNYVSESKRGKSNSLGHELLSVLSFVSFVEVHFFAALTLVLNAYFTASSIPVCSEAKQIDAFLAPTMNGPGKRRFL
jgi:hypothetical protein